MDDVDMSIVPVAPRVLAAVTVRTSRETLARDMLAALDRVWAFLRARPELRRDHNVVIYDGHWNMTAGVEVLDRFEPADDIERRETPGGRAVTAAHIGPYGELGRTYEALDAWIRASSNRTTGVTWEVYGDWEADPARLRTDLFAEIEG